jgi:hypothetical protein
MSNKERKMKKFLGSILVALVALSLPLSAQNRTRFGGEFNANDYAFGAATNVPALTIDNNITGTGSQTYVLRTGYIVLPDGTFFVPLFINDSVRVGVGASSELVTVTSVSCSNPQAIDGCNFTASFANAHGVGERVASATGGLYEAMYAAWISGGGLADIDPRTVQLGLTNTQLAAAPVWSTVAIKDERTVAPTYWSPGPIASTALATPTTLTALTAVPTSTPVGAYTTGTYHLCISYVDIMGNEGPCSADFSQAGLATGSFTFTTPAASAGAVGYTIYISLTGGAYTAMYHVPLSASICTLTTVETVTPACAVANTNYNQAGSTAVVTAITVNTAQLAMNSAVIGTTTVVHGNAIAKASYGYVPGSKLAMGGISAVYYPATGAAATSTNLDTVASFAIPANFMNSVGKSIRVCGQATMAGASTATILGISYQWDADGMDTAGAPVIIGTTTITPAAAVAASVVQYDFCQTFTTTVVGTTVTGGTIGVGPGYLSYSVTAPGTVSQTGPAVTVGTVGSLNFLNAARLHISFVHTTGTDGAATILQNATIEVL